jgi:demethylmenaquinone methyltransferase / 2-methoxy-6-polyprenyl-1,4-benzoquinol methylase
MTPSGLDAVEAHAAAAGGAGKRAYVRRMFSEIAPRYDLANHLLSLNLDRHWRRQAIRALAWWERPGGVYVDVCAGTLDVGATLAAHRGFRGFVLGTDFAEPMLRQGVGKAPAAALAPVAADALALPLPNDVAAGAIVAFGVRNLADLDAGLREMYRILAPGARLVILEFSTPPGAVTRFVYQAYFHHVLPALGGLVSGNSAAYRYLPESVASFPTAEALAATLRAVGFDNVQWRSLSLGIAAIHVGEKGPSSPGFRLPSPA